VNITVNYLAVLAAAIVSFILGAIWHGPLFGKTWADAKGLTPEQIEAGKKDMPRYMVIIFLLLVVVAWALAVLAGYTRLVTLMQGFKLGLICWIGFAVTVLFAEAAMTNGRKYTTFFISAGSWLITFLVSGMIVSYWH
jgi:hypothetical protein